MSHYIPALIYIEEVLLLKLGIEWAKKQGQGLLSPNLRRETIAQIRDIADAKNIHKPDLR
jgi:hypothetical protein